MADPTECPRLTVRDGPNHVKITAGALSLDHSPTSVLLPTYSTVISNVSSALPTLAMLPVTVIAALPVDCGVTVSV